MSDARPRLLEKNSRFFLLVLSEVNLLLGAFFFVQPSAALGLWPWPVKALALRFLGAIFLAITLGCWSALRARVWQRGKILVLVGAVFFGITTLIAVGVGLSQPGNLAVWAWVSYFLAASLGLLAILGKYGWFRRPQDRIRIDPPWKVARAFFRVQTAAVGIFGTMMLFLPEYALDRVSGFWPWQVAVPTLQTFGALFLATCLATMWASVQTERARIRALLPLDAIFPSLALLAVGLHWGVIESESPSIQVTITWLFLYSFVAAGSALLFFSSVKRTQY